MNLSPVLLMIFLLQLCDERHAQHLRDFGNDVKWESGELRFKNTESHRTESLKNIQIQLLFRNQLLKLSLTIYPSTLNSITVHDGNGELQIPTTTINCHWIGEVEGGGSVVLSNCEHSHYLEGVIKNAEGIWLIRPDARSLNGLVLKTKRFTRGIKRRRTLLLPPKSTALKIFEYVSTADVVRVPLQELESAAKLAAKDEDIRKHQQNFLQNPSLLKRSSRTVDVNKKWVEIAVFTDEALYNRMEKKFPSDTINKLKDYATTMINTMDLLYGDQSLSVSIGFRLVHLEVMKKSPKELNPSDGKAKAYLSSFCDYAGNKNINSGLWDHAILFTGIDVHEQGVKSTAGLAWASTMCYRYYSCSIAEGYSFGSAFIITHEIGHSLGMEHDGTGVSESCDRDKFIMSPTTGAGKVSWSNCSGENLKDFLEYGSSELRAKKYDSKLLTKPTCLSSFVSSSTAKNESKGKFPGESYDAFVQCNLGLGEGFKPYFQRNRPPFNNICFMLYCGNGTHAISLHPALEGTKCDKEKNCRRGECVKLSSR